MFAFHNEPLTDLSQEKNQQNMRSALEKVKKNPGATYPLLINGKPVWTEATFQSVNPARFKEVVGIVAKGSINDANQAVRVARSAFSSWSKTPYYQRAEYLFRAAKIMRSRRFELNAWLVLEVGKNWQEADADTAEAIDFLEYYGRQMLHLGRPRLTEAQVPGEINKLSCVPRGVGVVLGVWNFALAINTGMCAAAIVTGNTAVFKPASASAVVGYKLAEIFREAGLPDGVLNFLPGSGSEVGEALVRDRDIDFVVLTGSQEVGERIDLIAAGHKQPRGIKKRILETGGKNAIIIDKDADLDEAVRGVVASWLGYQGQKCSACSRLILLDSIHDTFIERLIEAAKSKKIGDPQDPGNFFGPLIDSGAQSKVRKYIEIGKWEGKRVLEINISPELARTGFYAGPVIFTEVDPRAKIAQEEIFGPVLAVIKVKNFRQALEAANHSDYALTGGLYSRSPKRIALAAENLNVGNFYINRPITGAAVGRQPFGGHLNSGTGPKAGGPDYLLAFMHQKIVSENTMRRGFAPTKCQVSIF